MNFPRMPIWIVAFTALAIYFPATAQVRKCTGPDGSVTYSDFLCNSRTTNESQLKTEVNTIDASGMRMEARKLERERQQGKEESQVVSRIPVDTTSCPSEKEIKNMETSVSSIAYDNKEKERKFLQAEIRRARACAKEGGNYTKEDWKRVKEGQDAQGNITSKSREAGRDLAEGVHSSAASDREQERMRTDKLAEAMRSAQRRNDAPIHMSTCDAAGCWDTNGQRYNKAAGGNFVRVDGAFCHRTGATIQCN